MAGKNLKISVLCDIYSGLLPEKQRLALDYYYNEDFSLSEIAELVGISRQGVRDQIKHAEAQLLSLEENLKLYEKLQKTEDILNKIKSVALETNNEQLILLSDELRSIYE